MLCYGMLCYVMLCYIMLLYVMLLRAAPEGVGGRPLPERLQGRGAEAVPGRAVPQVLIDGYDS